MYALGTNYSREVWMQVSLASVSPRDIPWCGWEVAGGMRRELPQPVCLFCYQLCWHWNSAQLHLSCSVAMQGRSHSINHHHSGKLWEAGKIWVFCKPKFLKLGEQGRELLMWWSHIHILQLDFSGGHCWRWWELVICSDLVWSSLCWGMNT